MGYGIRPPAGRAGETGDACLPAGRDMMGQFQVVQRLMGDENFRAFIAHPKVQEVFRDPELKEIASRKNFTKILSHVKFAGLMKEPEVAALMAKIDLKKFVPGGAF